MFSHKESNLSDGLEEILLKHNNIRLTEEDVNSLEGRLIIEISTSLKSMKKQKCTGIDGFPAEFLKVFWTKLIFLF